MLLLQRHALWRLVREHKQRFLQLRRVRASVLVWSDVLERIVLATSVRRCWSVVLSWKRLHRLAGVHELILYLPDRIGDHHDRVPFREPLHVCSLECDRFNVGVLSEQFEPNHQLQLLGPRDQRWVPVICGDLLEARDRVQQRPHESRLRQLRSDLSLLRKRWKLLSNERLLFVWRSHEHRLARHCAGRLLDNAGVPLFVYRERRT